jgi:hypothetical protein
MTTKLLTRVYITPAEWPAVQAMAGFAPYTDPRWYPAVGQFMGYEVRVAHGFQPAEPRAIDDEDRWIGQPGGQTFEEWTAERERAKGQITAAELLARATRG